MSEYQIPDFASIKQAYINKYEINTNLLDSTKFVFVTHNMPYLNFFCQSVVWPSVSSNSLTQETPFSTIKRAGDKLEYTPLTLTMIVDENMMVWEEAYNWLKGITFPHSHTEYDEQRKKGIYADMTMLVLKNSYETNFALRFLNCHPVALDSADFTYDADGTAAIKASFTLDYDSFQFVRQHVG